MKVIETQSELIQKLSEHADAGSTDEMTVNGAETPDELKLASNELVNQALASAEQVDAQSETIEVVTAESEQNIEESNTVAETQEEETAEESEEDEIIVDGKLNTLVFY